MATRRVFFSFDYNTDVRRVEQIRNMNLLNTTKIFHDGAEREQVLKKDKTSIENWINEQMNGCSCIVVLIGEKTFDSEWVQYEIKRGYETKTAMLGIYINNLKDPISGKSQKGRNVFEYWKASGRNFSEIYKVYSPNSNDAYIDIRDNLSHWIEDACKAVNR